MALLASHNKNGGQDLKADGYVRTVACLLLANNKYNLSYTLEEYDYSFIANMG